MEYFRHHRSEHLPHGSRKGVGFDKGNAAHLSLGLEANHRELVARLYPGFISYLLGENRLSPPVNGNERLDFAAGRVLGRRLGAAASGGLRFPVFSYALTPSGSVVSEYSDYPYFSLYTAKDALSSPPRKKVHCFFSLCGKREEEAKRKKRYGLLLPVIASNPEPSSSTEFGDARTRPTI
jgi:hypothetical protein